MRATDATLRVRIKGEVGIFTVKGATSGITRGEWQWEIPVSEAEELLELFCAGRTIEKTRHYLDHEGHEWVVDEFAGSHHGLVLAELELESEDEAFALPPWCGEEVSHDPQYYNAVLAGVALEGGP